MDDEIIRLPAMFKRSGLSFVGINCSSNATDGTDALSPAGNTTNTLKVGAFFPGVVNGIVMTEFNTCISLSSWGSLISGTDVLSEKVKSLYAKVNTTVVHVHVHDWNTHHNYGGEIHCGTKSVRDMDTEWY